MQSRASVARLAHNQKVGGSIPSAAPNLMKIPNECKGCGACCINKDSKWIEVNLIDSVRIPGEFLQQGDIEPFAMKQTENGRCVCLDKNNNCSIYDIRPTICRTVQKGDSICLNSLAAIV